MAECTFEREILDVLCRLGERLSSMEEQLDEVHSWCVGNMWADSMHSQAALTAMLSVREDLADDNCTIGTTERCKDAIDAIKRMGVKERAVLQQSTISASS